MRLGLIFTAYVAVFALFASAARAEANYTEMCDFAGDMAVGTVDNQGDAFDVVGTVFFDFYDAEGELFTDRMAQANVHVLPLSVQVVASVRAPAEAVTCSFYVAGAIGE